MKIHKRTILFALLVLGLVLVTGQVFAVSDTYDGITFHPFTMDADNNTCVGWDEDGDGTNETKNCDPINLVFPDQSAAQIVSALEARGWTTPLIGSSQELHFETPSLMTQDAQLAKTINSVRYHVRLWQVPGQSKALGAVHGETPLFHTINTDWEVAEELLAGELCGSDFVCGTSDRLTEQWAIQGTDPDNDDTTWREFNNDGHLTVIRANVSNSPPAANIIAPAADSTVAGDAVPIQVEANDTEDPVGTLTVHWRVNGGSWQPAAYNTGSGYYVATWDTTPLANGPYTIQAEVVDSGELTAYDSRNVYISNESTTSTIYVSLIIVEAVRVKGPQYSAVARVKVVDNEEAPVFGAAVSGTFSGDSNGDDSNITDSDGVATLQSPSRKNGTSWIFCVTGITAAGLEYIEADNVETCGSTDGPINAGAITGIVADLNGAPIPGASVTVETGQQTISDEAGNYTLAGVPEGDRIVSATAAGFISQEKPAVIVADAMSTLDFSLAPEGVASGTIKGTVTDDSTGKPVAGAIVSADTGQIATTNKRGRYAIRDVPEGQRTITAYHPGYNTGSSPATVVAGQTTTLDIMLIPIGP